jgi:GTP-binding protein
MANSFDNTIVEDPRLAADLEFGRKLFAGEVDFVMGAVSLETLPNADRPEVAFAGRSNVGKSSLINALFGRKALARASNTPGRTRELNYFTIGERLYVVDLPGYGYAKVSKTLVDTWTKLTRNFLRGRPNLQRVYVLIDSRHGLKDSDIELMKELDTAAVSYQLILTKADKCKQSHLADILEKTAIKLKKHPAVHPVVMLTSAEKGEGMALLRSEIGKFVK